MSDDHSTQKNIRCYISNYVKFISPSIFWLVLLFARRLFAP
jgi:hypothetical protein